MSVFGIYRLFAVPAVLAVVACNVGCSTVAEEERPEGVSQVSAPIRNGAPHLNPLLDGVVSIRNGDATGAVGFGSGTLVAADWVLTAAHVVDGRRTNPKHVTVTWGNDSDPARQQRTGVAIYHHPKHTVGQISGPSATSEVDVALVRLASPFTNAITKAISTGATSALLNTTVDCIGYGPTVEAGALGTLTYAWLPVVATATNHVQVNANQDLLFGSQIWLPGDSGGPCTNLGVDVAGVISSVDANVPRGFGYMVPAAAFRSWVTTTISSCASKVPGSDTFCDATCPCIYSGGDCDSDAECSTGNVCDENNGAGFGMKPATDACAPSSCASVALGADAFCSPTCPCGQGGGDCDGTDAQCQEGFTCDSNVGPAFKMKPETDVCVPTACASATMGSSTYCSATCPCGHGGGDCDSNADCMPGLVCGTDLGPAFDMTSTTDVCVPSACSTGTLLSADFCTAACPCGHGGGDCDDDSQCMPGLVCGTDNGPEFGGSATTDVCVRP